jgi:hypothetical protein
MAARPTRSARSTGWVPYALIALVLIPVIAGSLRLVELVAFSALWMAACIVLGLAAIVRGDVTRHQAWMTPAYALALGAGTQAFTLGIGKAIFGTSELTHDLSLGAGWAINLAVAEYVIRRQRSRRTFRAAVQVGVS